MTEKEAIKRLESYRNYLCAGNPIWDTDEVAEVFGKAINAVNREQQFLDAGYKNERVEFYIGGRKFVVKEIAQ